MVANLLYALTSLPPLWLLLDSAQYVVICGGTGFVCSLPMTESFFLRVVQSSHPSPPPGFTIPNPSRFQFDEWIPQTLAKRRLKSFIDLCFELNKFHLTTKNYSYVFFDRAVEYRPYLCLEMLS